MANLTDIDNVAPAHSLKAGADVLNTWRARLDELHQTLGLGSLTAVEVTQLQAIGPTTISATQWGYVGAFDQGLTTSSTVTFGTINAFTLGGKLTAGSSEIEGSNFDINGGTIDGITSLTAGGALDIGAYGFRAATLTADGLTATRVIFAGTNGLLSDDSDMTFATDTLTVTKLGAFQAAGAINFDSQNMTNVDIDSGTVGGVTLDGAIAGGDQTFTNVGNMTFAAGSILASGSTNTNTLLLKANDTTCITLTTAATDQMDLAAVYSLTAINNLDIGSYTFTCAGLIDDTLTSGRVVFASSGGLLADDADMTFSTDTLTVKKLVLNDATTATTDMLTLTPAGAVAAAATWKGIYINGDALDPAGTNAAIEGIYVDLSGVAAATGLEMRGVYTSVPAGLGYEAIHSIGKIKLDNDESALAPGETATGVDIIVLASAASGGEYHAIDVATTGTSSASLTALGTHTGIDVIHQHTGTFISPTKAWLYDDSETSYADATTAFGSAGTDVTMFVDDDDAIFIGATAAFDEIEVILATAASVDIKPTFWYSKAASFTQFFPADDTEGFTQDGTIRFDASDLTDFAAQSVNGTSKFYIKIVRTKNNVTTDPIEDTIKTLAATECFWNAAGAMQVVSIAVPTITTVTTFTAGGNLDIGSYTLTAGGLIDDTLTSGRVVFVTTGGQLADDSDFTFATDTLTVTKLGAFEATGAINFGNQALTNLDINSGTIDGISALTSTGNLDIGAHTFRAATLIADGLAVDKIVTTTTNGQLTDANAIRMDNLCRNTALASRSGGTSAVPDEWTLEGTPTVAYDTVDTGYGDFAVKLTASGAGDEGINQTLTHLKVSTTYQVFARVKVDSGDTASLITTGATTNINADSTSASWENITGEFTTDGSGTDVVIKLVASADTDVAYFCGITCVEGDIPPGNFIRRVNETIYLPTKISDTSWDGDAKDDADSAILDLSAFGNGCPPKIKAVHLEIVGRDSASAAAGDCNLFVGPTSGNTSLELFLAGQPNDIYAALSGYVPCDANGDVYVYIDSTGEDTMDVHIRVWGYVLGE